MTTKTPSQRIALLEAKLARAKADERKQRTRRLIEVGAMLEPLGERVAALTAEQRKYFISRVLANWEALMGTKGNNQHQGDACSALARPAAAIFRDAPDFGLPTPKSGYGFPQPRKSSPSGLGEGVRFSLHRGPPRALYTGYGSMPT
jgi:hypothetical protein